MRLRAFFLAVLAPSLVGCSTGDAVDAGIPCPNDIPAACPAQVPSYATDIAPLLQERCAPCHFSGGAAGPTWDLSTYSRVFMVRSAIFTQVSECLMPPVGGVADAGVEAGAPGLSESQRVTLFSWLKCNAPNN